MAPELPKTEYFCPNCPNTLMLYADQRQTIENVYLPEEKKVVTLFFDVCECPDCEISVLIERKLPVES
jgi:hypothetical protein